MHPLLTAAASLALVPACAADISQSLKERPAANSTAAAPPDQWVMSPDSFGPITVGITRAQAMATGAYTSAPSPCSRQRLDWRGQTYEAANADVDGDGTPDKDRTKPFLGAVTFDQGAATFIDPGKDTVTDEGIRKADSLSRLQLTYGGDLIPGRDQSPGTGSFAVNGARSHLVFEVWYGKVVGFYIAAGRVKNSDDVEAPRFRANGIETSPDKMPMGHDGVC